MPEWLVSASGEIGTKRPGTQRELKVLLEKNLRSRAQALGLSFEWQEIKGRFLLRGPEPLQPLLLSHFGFSKVCTLLRLKRRSFLDFDFHTLLPSRPFVYTVYVTRFADQGAREEGLAFKKELLSLLEKAARERLENWDNHWPEEVSWEIEVWPEEVWLLTQRHFAPAGLPVGSGEKVLVLFSGGPDSLLAAYLLARRGQEIELVFFDDDEKGRFELVQKAARALAYFLPGLEIRLWQLHYRSMLERLEEMVPLRERCFFCRALMLHLASYLLTDTGAKALATGEILGEQASQTLTGLVFVQTDLPLLRPVVALNKEEVYQMLEAVGLAGVAHLPLPTCPFAPKRPRTRPTKTPFHLKGLWRKFKKPVFIPHLLKAAF